MDLFKQRRADQEKLERLEELESILDAINRSRAAIEFDVNGNIINANDNFLKVMGYRLDEIKGRHHSMFVRPGFEKTVEYENFWKSLRDGEYRSDKFPRIAKDGSEVIIQAAYNPVIRGGKTTKIVKFATDITDVEKERERHLAERAREEQIQNTVVSALRESLQRLAGGDLSAEINQEFDGRYSQIRTDFNQALRSLAETMRTITSATSVVNQNADEIASAADSLSQRTEQQAANLEQTAAALDELTATVKVSAGRASDASVAASEARADASTSGKKMEEAVAAMSEIDESSGKITQIIAVIDEIAFQTNLLALNAGVEAARAGEAGRGFAVVASEVRALAQRSAVAAKEIKGLIASSAAQVRRGVTVVGETGQALTEIVKKVSDIDGLIKEMAESSREQATALNEVNTAINQVDQITQQNAAMVEQTTAAASVLKAEASQLGVLVSGFQTGESAPSAAVRRPSAGAAPHRQSNPPRTRGAVAVGGGRPVHQPSDGGWEEF